MNNSHQVPKSRFALWIKRKMIALCERLLADAQKDPTVTYDEYKKLKAEIDSAKKDMP